MFAGLIVGGMVVMKFFVLPMLRAVMAQGKRLRQLQGVQAIACIVSVITAAVTGNLEVRWELGLLCLFGMVSATASLASWAAAAQNQAATSSFSQLDDLLAITVAAVFCGEAGLLQQPLLLFGMLFCFAGGFYLWRAKATEDSQRALAKGQPGTVNVRFFLCVAWFSIVWAGDSLVYKWMTVSQGVNPLAMMAWWYIGTVVSTSILGIRKIRESRIVREPENEPLTRGEWLRVAVFSLGMLLTGWLYLQAHAVMEIVPLRALSQGFEIVGGLMVGIYFLRKSHVSTTKTLTGSGVVLAGAVSCVLGYIGSGKRADRM